MTSFTERFQNDAILQRVLDSTREYAVFMLDPEGVVATWNDGARRIKGYEAEEIVGQHYRLLYLPEDRKRGHPEHNLETALKNGEYREERLRMRRDSSTFAADVDISPIYDEAGRHAGFLKVVHDVSERKRLEDEACATRDELDARVRERTAELSAANGELEAFCQTVAHDFRAPIRNIVLRCRMAEEDLGESAPPEAIEHFRSLSRNAKRLAELTDDLLEYARLGKKPLARKRVDVTGLARRLAAEIAPEIAPARHNGSAVIDVQEGLDADADPQLLQLALRNLIENACKYSKENVRVVIGREAVEDGEAFFVRDDGIGFDMAFADKLFQPFERLHGNSGIDGTGIGLANVRRVVERHGGRIWAASKVGEGATFWFTLGQG